MRRRPPQSQPVDAAIQVRLPAAFKWQAVLAALALVGAEQARLCHRLDEQGHLRG